MYRRKFYTTSKRWKFGIGPNGMRKGDLVVVLLGDHVPYLLREEGGHYVLVGETFIDGILAGEFIRSYKNQEVDSSESGSSQGNLRPRKFTPH